ncbi:MAG: NTE family protein [Limisphaerales bacterium]
MNDSTNTPRIGLALGSGASRGWSHIGVIKALLEAGIEPDVVCGTSVGAMVGGSYLAGNLDKLESWVLGSSRSDVLRFFSFRLAHSAFVDIERLNWFLHNFVAAADVLIEELARPYAAVCTDLESGREVLLQKGGMADAVRASMAMPGLFPAERNKQRWLVDGGLVDPVPVTACRMLGADIVIGVNLNSDILSRRHAKNQSTTTVPTDSTFGNLKEQARAYSNSLFVNGGEPDKTPGLFSTISHTINIFQDQITRGRLEADPADVLIAPKVGDIGMFDFQRAADAIIEGEACVRSAMVDIRRLSRARQNSTD